MYRRILVPIDGSPTAARGLDEAIEIARLTGATIRLLHVLDEMVLVTGYEMLTAFPDDLIPMLKEGGERILADAKTRVAAAGIPVDTLLVECMGPRASEVVVQQAESWNADLIVLGTHGRRGVRRAMLGSDAEQIVRTATVPVLLVRAAEAGAKAPSSEAKEAGA